MQWQNKSAVAELTCRAINSVQHSELSFPGVPDRLETSLRNKSHFLTIKAASFSIMADQQCPIRPGNLHMGFSEHNVKIIRKHLPFLYFPKPTLRLPDKRYSASNFLPVPQLAADWLAFIVLRIWIPEFCTTFESLFRFARSFL